MNSPAEILEAIRSGNLPMAYWIVGTLVGLLLLGMVIKITKWLLKLAVGITILVSLVGAVWWLLSHAH